MGRAVLLAGVLGACGFSGRGASSVPDPDAADPDGTVAQMACPPDYGATVVAGVYRVVDTPAKWNDARVDCRDDGATTHLVVLGTDDERLAVRALHPTGDLWLGLSDRVVTGQWRWVTTEDTQGYPPSTLGQAPWKTGQPSDGDGGAQDCAEMEAAGLWDDKRCDNELRPYVCECDANAEDLGQSDPQS